MSVRIIIDFCEWDMKGDEALLLIGSLNYDFGGSRTKTGKNLQKQALATGIWMFRDPDLRRFLSRFGVIFEKQTHKISSIWLRFSARYEAWMRTTWN